MRKTMKIRLAVFLSIILVLPTIVSVLPMASTEVLAAGTQVGLYWDFYDQEIEVEEGQQFYIGDYAHVNVYGKTYWYGRVSLVKATYTSSDKQVADVDKSGCLTTKKAGTTTVTIKYKGKKISTKMKVVPKGTFTSNETTVAMQKQAELIQAQMPSKVTTKRGFALFELTANFRTDFADSKEITIDGFLKEKSEEDNQEYYFTTTKLAVPQAGRYEALNAMLYNYAAQNNPTGTRGAKLFKIKSVSATRNAIVIKLKNKIDTTQILAARILDADDNDGMTGNTKANSFVVLRDKKANEYIYCDVVLTKGSKTLKLIPMQYSAKKGKDVRIKLKKGRTYMLENKQSWTKGKQIKIK